MSDNGKAAKLLVIFDFANGRQATFARSAHSIDALSLSLAVQMKAGELMTFDSPDADDSSQFTVHPKHVACFAVMSEMQFQKRQHLASIQHAHAQAQAQGGQIIQPGAPFPRA